MSINKLTKSDLENVSGGSDEEFFNTCKECGKVWDMREYGYGKASAVPNWVTGPWCPDCRKKQREEFLKKSGENNITE